MYGAFGSFRGLNVEGGGTGNSRRVGRAVLGTIDVGK